MHELSPLTGSTACKPAAFETVLQLPGFIDAVNERAIIAVTDHDGRFVFVNDAFCAISKYAVEELLGEHYSIIGSGHHPQSFFDVIEKTVQAGTVWRGRIKNRAKNGSYYWVDTIIVPILNDAGELTYSVSVRNDITELVTAQEDLERIRQNEAAIGRILAIALSDVRIDRMLEGSLEVLSFVPGLAAIRRSAVFLLDATGRTMTPAACRDLSSDEAGHAECFGACVCERSAHGRTTVVAPCTHHPDAAAAGPAVQSEHIAVPLVSQVGLLGVLVLTAKISEAQAIPQDNFLTDVAKALSVGIEQKHIQDGLKAERELVIRKQQQLEEKSALMEAGFDNMVEGLVALTPDLTILAANRRFAELMGIPPELAQQGRSFEPILACMRSEVVERSKGAAMSAESMRKIVRGGTGQPVRFKFRSGKSIEARANPIPEIGTVFTVADVTEALATEVRARQSHKLEALGDLAGGVAHEYNNLLTSIQGFARMALKKFSDEDRVRESLQEIIEASGRASEITQQMLTFSKKQVLSPVVIDVGVAIRAMEPMLRVFVQSKLELRFDFKSRGQASVDPSLLTECIGNLVKNSRQAMPDGGTITIICDTADVTDTFVTSHGDMLPPGRYVSIAVSDTGRGMDPGTLSQIFDPFFTTREVGAGTGLGLSMVFGMAKNQHGAIDVESAPGQGATFTIYLPAVDGQSEVDAQTQRQILDQPPPPLDLNVVPTEEDAEQLMRFL